MGWKVADDQGFYDTARALQRHVGSRWLVFWGPGSRSFWAFLRGGPYPLMLSAPTPQDLLDQMQRHQR